MRDTPNSRTLLAQKLVRLLPLVLRSIASHLRERHGILSPGHIGVLKVLHNNPCHLGRLAQQLEVSAPTISNTISMFVERGWVRRWRDPSDRRRVLVELTDEGKATLCELSQTAEEYLVEILSPLSERDCLQMANDLELLERIFQKRPPHS